MAAPIVTIAQQKGGAGKTSLTAHLAAAWAGRGLRVAAFDLDPQGSLSAWASVRADDDQVPAIAVQAVPGWRTTSEIERAARQSQYDLILVDCPPHGETAPKFAIRAADLVVVPMQPSPLDLWATRDTIALIVAERRRPIVVFNRVPPRGVLSDAIREAVAESGTPIARTTIGNRQAFASAIIEGLGITEYEPGGSGGLEMAALTEELTQILRKR